MRINPKAISILEKRILAIPLKDLQRVLENLPELRDTILAVRDKEAKRIKESNNVEV